MYKILSLPLVNVGNITEISRKLLQGNNFSKYDTSEINTEYINLAVGKIVISRAVNW